MTLRRGPKRFLHDLQLFSTTKNPMSRKPSFLLSLFNLRTVERFNSHPFRFHRPQIPTTQLSGNRNMAGSSGADIIAMHENMNPNTRGERRNDQGGSRGRGRGGRGGRGGGGGMSRDVVVSKGLSKLLRHAAQEAGLSLDAEGFARVDQVVRISHFNFKSTQKEFPWIFVTWYSKYILP